MADATRPAIGLSIGATNLAAVTADRSVTRKPVLTLYGQRPPEVGLPSENPQLDEPGLVITDFVNRVPGRVVASDGSTHRSEVLVADALRALVYAATNGGAPPESIVVTHPAHWQPAAVDALRAALGPGSGWLRDVDPVLMDDAVAAANALQTNPGLPDSGVIAVCDFGGSGTSLTLLDAANGYQRIGATLRHAEFSGDLIDQALLNHVVADLSAAGSFDTSATSAIGSLTRLRADCRLAKEQLSMSTMTTLTAELPGYHGELQVTRADLDEAIRQPLATFISAFRDVLLLNGLQASDVVAVAAVGGGANLPVITTTLSDQLRAPVIIAPRPQLTPAIGAALWAARGPGDAGPTALAPAVDAASPLADLTTVLDPAPVPDGGPALAWSEADDDTGISPLLTGEYPAASAEAPAASGRPPTRIGEEAGWDSDDSAAVPWYRRTVVLIIAAALVMLAIAGAIMLSLRHTSSTTPVTPSPSISTGPATGTSAPGTTATQNPTETQQSDTNQPSSTTSESPSSTQSTTSTTTEPSTQTSTTQVTTTQLPPLYPNRPFGPDYPRRPGYPEPGPGPGVREPGQQGR
jgi:actin-like ATPase involved in cell morphogenesis